MTAYDLQRALAALGHEEGDGMDGNFNRALSEVLKHEGGYVNHPNDPGGPTNLGITLANFRRYVKPNGTIADLRNLTVQQAGVVYRRRYWDAVLGADLPSGVDFCVFDYAVNSGPSRAVRHLQEVLGVAVDGRIGPRTLAAIRNRLPADVIHALCDRRLRFLRALKTWKTFGKGWSRRVGEVRSVALDLSARDPAPLPPVAAPIPAPRPPVHDHVREVVEDAAASRRVSTTEIVTTVTGLSGLAATVKELIDNVRDGFVSLVDIGPWVLLALVVAGGAIYVIRERRRKKATARVALASIAS